MSLSAKRTKRALSLVLCLVLLVSTVAFAISASAKDVETIADTGADTYYLWGESTTFRYLPVQQLFRLLLL